ncbi:PBP1A family penicillin-binding protein [Bacillaceae bacterium S4-13-56]
MKEKWKTWLERYHLKTKKIIKDSGRWLLNKKWIWIAVLSTIAVSFIGYGLIYYGGSKIVDEREFVLDTTTTIVTEDGEEIAQLYNQNRTLVPIDDIPHHVQEAFIAVEDKRFYEHAGIDSRSVLRAIFRNIASGKKAEGASTITQQLVKNIFLTNEKTWTRKIKEVMAATYLEHNYTKQKILEYYLNTIYFGHGVYGIEAASEYFFQKKSEELTTVEGAMLAAIPKAPNYYSPTVNPVQTKERRNLVLRLMQEEDYLTAEEAVRLSGRGLGVTIDEEQEKPWIESYVDLVIREASQKYHIESQELRRGGYKVVVGLNPDLQKITYNYFQKEEFFPGTQKGAEGSVVFLDADSGNVVAALGGRDFSYGDLNRVNVKRQPGSTIKPLAVYGPLLELPAFNPYTLIPDELKTYEGDYKPHNVDEKYQGEISIYDALRLSKNTSAVWALDQIGIPDAKDYLAEMGIQLDDNGLAIALGGLNKGVTPLQMAGAFRTFRANGNYIEPYFIEAIYDKHNNLLFSAEKKSKQVFNSQTAWDITRILESVVQNGTAQTGSYSGPLAGKTGTTQLPIVQGGIRDSWFVGYTPEFVGSLWMGFDQSDEERYLTRGSAAATTLMKAILEEYSKENSVASAFQKPDGVSDLEPPMDLPVINDVQEKLKLNGLSLRVELSWSASPDKRVVYRVYRWEGNKNMKLIGDVKGKGKATIKNVSLFETARYVVVPYNPLTQQEGEPSNVVTVSWGFR